MVRLTVLDLISLLQYRIVSDSIDLYLFFRTRGVVFGTYCC